MDYTMEEIFKAVDLLDQNELYDTETKKGIYLNRFKDYFTDKEEKRNEKGEILLDETPFIMSNVCPEGRVPSKWILLKTKGPVLLKEDDYKTSELELLFMTLAKRLGIECAEYDVATFEGMHYTFSPNFLRQNEFMVNYNEFSFYIPSEQHHRLIDIDSILKAAPSKGIKMQLMKMLYIDLLTENKDRFFDNVKVVYSPKGIRLSVLFDNGGCCNNIEKYKYNIPAFNGNYENNILFERLLLEDEGFKNWVVKNIDEATKQDYAKELMTAKKVLISEDTSTLFCDTVNKNAEVVKSLL